MKSAEFGTHTDPVAWIGTFWQPASRFKLTILLPKWHETWIFRVSDDPAWRCKMLC
jgi:hypothetical protein